MHRPGAIVLFGSGETAAVGREALRWLAAGRREPRSVAVLETPAGFEPNAEEVAGQYADFLARQAELHGADVVRVPARKRGTPFSPDEPEVVRPILAADLVAFGAGSPTYTVRQLDGSLAWEHLVATHLLGASLFLASAAAIAAGTCALPVYEIYKVGEDPHWKDGLRLFEAYGLRLAVVTHWDNTDGGDTLDTSRCYMGGERFRELAALLPGDVTIVGIDEHTALAIDPSARTADVLGRGHVTLVRERRERALPSGATLALEDLGPFAMPDPQRLVPADTRAAVASAREPAPPPNVGSLVASRERARAARDWRSADRIRDAVAEHGWRIEDTPAGPRVIPERDR